MSTPTQYVTDTGGMPEWVTATINALLPILPGDPAGYVDPTGRIDLTVVKQGQSPHTHSTGPAADLIVELWNGWSRNSALRLTLHADSSNRRHLARALRTWADGIDPTGSNP